MQQVSLLQVCFYQEKLSRMKVMKLALPEISWVNSIETDLDIYRCSSLVSNKQKNEAALKTGKVKYGSKY